MDIIYKEWDSVNFGFRIGEVSVNSASKTDIENILDESKKGKYKLLYLHSNVNLNIPFFYDEKITYIKERCLYSSISDNNIRNGCRNDFDRGLYKLALESGKFSRFNLDPNFPKVLFELLYRKWIENSIDKIIASDVFLYDDLKKDSDILGMITCKNSENISEIGIIATNSQFQGSGIGSKLISYYESNLPSHIKSLEVVTQGINTMARRFYEKHGFSIKNIEYIYHLWV